MGYQTTLSGSVVVGQIQSNALKLNQLTPVGIILSGSVVTGTKLTFLVSTDGTNYYSLYDDTSTEVSLTVTTASRAYNFQPVQVWPWNWMKVREGTTASPVVQATYDALFSIKLMSF